MIKANLLFWSCSLAVVSLSIVFAAFLVSNLIQLTTDYGQTKAVLVLQRVAIQQLMLNVEHNDRVDVYLAGDMGSESFKERRQQLEVSYKRLAIGRGTTLKLERLGRDFVTAAATYASGQDNRLELITSGRLYCSMLDLVEGSLDGDRQDDLDYRSVIPVITLIALAWLIATAVLYWACFGVTYGYDLFMRDNS